MLNLIQHLVVLTPCCSIKEKIISVVPLIEAKRKPFFKNENYRRDMTLLNKPRLPKEWRDLGEEVTSKSEEEAIYAYDNLFIFPENDLLKKYRRKT